MTSCRVPEEIAKNGRRSPHLLKTPTAPKIYFDVLRGEGDDEGELLGRLDLSGVAIDLRPRRVTGRRPAELSVSRHHATITFDADVAYVPDIKSTHGTSDYARRVRKNSTLTRLDEGVRLRFGESSRRYVLRRSAQGAAGQVQQQQPVMQEAVILRVPLLRLKINRPKRCWNKYATEQERR